MELSFSCLFIAVRSFFRRLGGSFFSCFFCFSSRSGCFFCRLGSFFGFFLLLLLLLQAGVLTPRPLNEDLVALGVDLVGQEVFLHHGPVG